MKIALISDIHGNDIALQTVLADIACRGVDQIVCLGDTLTLGPQPHQVLHSLRQAGCRCVLGNHDEEYLRPELAPPSGTWLGDDVAWCAAQLTADDLAYLASFQSQIVITLEGGQTMLCCHATPRNNQEALLATTPNSDVEAMLAGQWSHRVIAFGHTHTQMLRLHYESMLVCVGSVAYPIARPWSGRGEDVQAYPWCEYAIIHSESPRVSVEFCRLPMNAAAVFAAVQASDMPWQDSWLKVWGYR